MKSSEHSFTDETSNTSSTLSKPYCAYVDAESTNSQKPKPRNVSPQQKQPQSKELGTRVCYLLFGGLWLAFSLAMLILCIRDRIEFAQLKHATCEVEKAFPQNEYDLKVIPESEEGPFILRLNTTGLGVDDLKDGDSLQCFFGDMDGCTHVSGVYNRTGAVYLQFDSDRRNVDKTYIILPAIFISPFVIVGACIFLSAFTA